MRFFGLEKIDRFLKRDARRDVEIDVEAGRQIIRGGFHPRLFDRLALVHDELQRRLERNLDGAAVDFAVALNRVAVAGEKLPALVEHRQKQRRTDAAILEIDIAAPSARRGR